MGFSRCETSATLKAYDTYPVSKVWLIRSSIDVLIRKKISNFVGIGSDSHVVSLDQATIEDDSESCTGLTLENCNSACVWTK